MTTLFEYPAFAGEPSPYHVGQRTVQSRVGVRESSEMVGRRVIRKYMNEQAKAFFEELPFVFVGVKNSDGCVWATTLVGPPGFLHAVDDTTVRASGKQMYGDPAHLAAGSTIGIVGVMLHNRRRNKLNGTIEAIAPDHMSLRITHSLGNCPKYIQVRSVVVDDMRLATLGSEARQLDKGGGTLGGAQRAFIARADTAFLATSFSGHADGAGTDAKEYCNINHRGGAPGFVKVMGDGTLLLPDYVGNNLYQSLGNIYANSEAGLQFVDFANGDSLQLTGQAQILFDEHSLPGAQRTIRFVTSQWVHVRGGLPFSTKGPVEFSPYNPLPAAAASSQGRRLQCVSRRSETHDIETFSFPAPLREGGSPFCQAGQFASFDFPALQPGSTLNRTWTISSSPDEIAETGRFTISVKKAGLVSSWLHDRLHAGREVLFRGVDGDFTLDAAKCIPPAGVLLVAGGIGVTPMRVMFAECLKRGYPVTLLYSVRSAEDAAFLDEFQQGAVRSSNAAVVLAITSGQLPDEGLGGVPAFKGRLTAAMIEQVCPDVAGREVFQCGPQAMMNSAAAILEGLGVAATRIHQENFSF